MNISLTCWKRATYSPTFKAHYSSWALTSLSLSHRPCPPRSQHLPEPNHSVQVTMEPHLSTKHNQHMVRSRTIWPGHSHSSAPSRPKSRLPLPSPLPSHPGSLTLVLPISGPTHHPLWRNTLPHISTWLAPSRKLGLCSNVTSRLQSSVSPPVNGGWPQPQGSEIQQLLRTQGLWSDIGS